MEIEEAKRVVEKMLPEKRFRHTVGVSRTAAALAERYGASKEKAALAGMLHDIAKYFSDDQLKAIIKRRPDITDRYLHYSSKLWHAPAGAAYVQEQLGIDDPEILNAMTYHTTGKRQMSVLEKIIFLADYIEPGRDFPGVEPVRQAAEKSLDGAVIMELRQTIMHLLEKGRSVYPDTFDAYNDLVRSREQIQDNEVTE